MQDLTMRWAGPDDRPGLLRLFTEVYGTWPKVAERVNPADHLAWKYEDIGVQSSRVTIALDGDRIVGAIPLSIHTFLVDGQPRLGASAWDVAVDAGYRESGLYMEMQWFSRGTYRNSLDFNFGYEAPHPGMARAREKLGSWKLMAQRIDILTARVSNLPAPAGVTDVTIESIERVDESVDAFCLEAMRPFRLVQMRNHRYLNWRYLDPRGGGGTLLLARRGSDIVGLAALRISNRIAYVADLLVLPGRNDVAGALTSACLERARTAGIEKARCWLPERHPYREAVAAAGFSRVKETRACTYEVLQTSEDELAFLEDPDAPIHSVAGDTDLV